MQSELETAVQEKSSLKWRLNHLELSDALNCQKIESLNSELEELKKIKFEEAKESENEIFKISNKIKEKISVRRREEKRTGNNPIVLFIEIERSFKGCNYIVTIIHLYNKLYQLHISTVHLLFYFNIYDRIPHHNAQSYTQLLL